MSLSNIVNLSRLLNRLRREADLLKTEREANSFHHSKSQSLCEANRWRHRFSVNKVIVECARLRQKIRGIAKRNPDTEREEQCIGRDLHGGLGQYVHGVSFLAVLYFDSPNSLKPSIDATS